MAVVLTFQVRAVLYAVGRANQQRRELYLREIAEETELTQPTVSAIVKRLSHGGLVQVRETPNSGTRTTKRLKLTDKAWREIGDLESLIPRIWRK